MITFGHFFQMASCHGGGCFMMWTLTFQLILCGSEVYATNSTKNCKMFSESDQKVLSLLEPLMNKK